jgi:hypothetical protein
MADLFDGVAQGGFKDGRLSRADCLSVQPQTTAEQRKILV